jgi:hypothetical protein
MPERRNKILTSENLINKAQEKEFNLLNLLNVENSVALGGY